MDSRENGTLKKALADPEHLFDKAELTRIINRVFFDDTMAMDTELVDLAARRLASLQGCTVEEQYNEIANSALKRLFSAEK